MDLFQRHEDPENKEARELANERGVPFHKALHWVKLGNKRKEMERKIKAAKTPEQKEKLSEQISEKISHHIHRGSKDREYKNYDGAAEHDDYQEMYEEMYTLLNS